MYWVKYMNVSKNRSTPKSSILVGFSIINYPLWEVPQILETPIYVTMSWFLIVVQTILSRVNFLYKKWQAFANRPPSPENFPEQLTDRMQGIGDQINDFGFGVTASDPEAKHGRTSSRGMTQPRSPPKR